MITVDSGIEHSQTETTQATAHQLRFADSAAQRAERLLRQEVSFVHNPGFEHLTIEQVEADASGQSVFVQTQAKAQRGLPVYLANLYSLPLLSIEGERALFRKMNYLKYRANVYRSALDPDQPDEAAIEATESLLDEADQVRTQLIESNLRLIVSIARRYSENRENSEDLVGEGNMILMRAVELFDVSRGFRFSTYVTNSVQRHFYRVCRKHQHRRTSEVCNSDAILSQVPARSGDFDDDRQTLVGYARRLLGQMDDCLDAREQSVVRARFGFGSQGKERTFQSLSADLGVCKERVRQIHNKAIEKLKKKASELGLEASMCVHFTPRSLTRSTRVL